MRPLILAYVLLLTVTVQAQQQIILLLTEDFEQPSSTFAFDTGGLGGTTGPNQWVINNKFDGGGTYPNTTNQDSISSGSVLGTISNAPFSTYLHIHDINATPAVANANYNASSASDRFAYTAEGFCTLGLIDVTLTFFYICEGTANAYGEVYYSANGGPWTKTGAAKYNNQNKWEYVILTNPALDNVADLRFGFRWVNDAGSPPSSMSFGIDEVILVATYDPITGPQISVSQVVPNPVCQQAGANVFFQFTQPMCAGGYDVQLSNASGSFSNPTSLGGRIIFGGTSFGLTVTIPVVTPGSCYKIRVNRNTPPVIIGSPSQCFAVQACPNTITTLQPIVTADVDTVCSLSAIDVPFYSTGVYLSGNDYIAQLSDSAGRFEETVIDDIDTVITIDTTVFPADTTVVYDTSYTTNNLFKVLGMAENDNTTYDPALGSMPGSVSGLIPRMPESCNYYIRVVSNRPNVIGSLYGPFCIKQCDITTNNTIDISVCIMQTVGVDTTITIDIHEWDSTALYLAGNQFIVQVLDMMTLAVVNEGALGVKIDVASTTMTLTIPGRDLLPFPPGTYYMRIIADNSTNPWNSNGTIIRLTIGAPDDNPAVIISDKDAYCDTEVGEFLIVPYNNKSKYHWYSAEFFGSSGSVVIDGNPVYFSFVGARPLRYGFIVVEENYGCYGPASPTKYVNVITQPDVNISGPQQVCAGDTFIYRVTFISQTYYDWSVSWGRIIDTSNNEIVVTFDSAGTVELNLYAINNCGVKTGTYSIEVISLLQVDAGEDREICNGETTTLSAESEGLSRELTTSNSGSVNVNGNMFDLRAREDVTISSFDVFLPNGANVSIAIYYRPATYVGAEYDPSSWTILNIANNVVSNGMGIPTPIPIPVNISIPAGQTYGFYITTTDGSNWLSTTSTASNPVYADPFLEFNKGTGNVYPFGSITNNLVWNGVVHYKTFGGVSFIWSDGATTAENNVSPDSSMLYTVLIKDTAGCGSRDSVFVTVNPLPNVIAVPDDTTFCIGGEVQLSASGADTYEWSPAEGLSDANISNPLAVPQQSILYTVKGKYDETGCINYATTGITVLIDLPTILEVNLCDGESYFAGGAEQTVPGTYFDTLTGANGCDSIVVTTIVAAIEGCDLTLVIPQAFTPNGDQSNNHFTVFGDNIDKYEIRIFNRWGEQVYYSTNASEVSKGDFTKGWDGTYQGKPQDMGVYVYYIKASKGIETPVERKGNVTLIR